MHNLYNITLSKNDALIAVWKRKTIEAGHEKATKLVKSAILSFIETGECIDIGHIHFHPEQETVKKGDIIQLQIATSPIIRRWIEANVAAGLGVSEPIKFLLKNSIKIVPDTEGEYFPSANMVSKLNCSSMLELMRENARKITGKELTYSQKNDVSIPETAESSVHIPNESKKTNVTPVEIKDTVQTSTVIKPVVKKEQALENNQVISGLNGLLPQRASKKTRKES